VDSLRDGKSNTQVRKSGSVIRPAA
jgi:hypothetical protein